MAEQPVTKKRGPAVPLLIVGLLALAVSAWALVGPGTMSVGGAISFGWIMVITAIVIGVMLVISPRKRR
ncbi:hypothetical protein AB0H76_36560 [Nocardia sp. NPDC050712]|uniref:hypothetical protein n=1 Tax=Nocardia sp. NPDC050712 TaxID=3155518 RepID=UPI003401B924